MTGTLKLGRNSVIQGYMKNKNIRDPGTQRSVILVFVISLNISHDRNMTATTGNDKFLYNVSIISLKG